MKTVKLNYKNIYSGNLLLVNANHPIKISDINDLVPFDILHSDILLKRDAADALQSILTTVSAGNQIVPVSGYRSTKEQTDIYNNSTSENGIEFTKKYVALPERSEHQTGLAIDLGLNKKNIDFICPDFPYDGMCEKFREAAPDYGYIQRYKKDKEKITGISHEPWHFRYVGFPHSKIIEENNFLLEEYMDFIKEHDENNKYIYKCADEYKINIFYVKASEDEIVISIPEQCTHQISGNNIDGFIVTIWENEDRS